MERILNDNEKIRKAEEIYYRRNHREAMRETVKRPKDGKTYLGSKIVLEMLILILSVIAIFAVKNRNYIFTQNFLDQVAQYNVNFSEKFAVFMKYFENDDKKENEEVFIHQDNPQTEEIPNHEEVPKEETTSEVPQEGISYIKPIEGVVTSRFGERDSGTHTGIDIAANVGTEIQSSISGVVTQVSTEGNYGNHVRVSKDNITTLYAHCNEICVAEGQEIAQGQVIALVGSTGNSTGPHLHFEIIIDGNQVNPDEIIEFS